MAESSDKDAKIEEPQKIEDDLDSLLDSALGDFTETSKEKPPVKKEEVKSSAKEDDVELVWTEMIKQALQVDPNIREMFPQGEENAFVQDFTKLAEAAAKAIEGDSTSNSFAEIMSETLKSLNKSSEAIQNQFSNPEELANLFQEMGLNGVGSREDGSIEDIPPFMQSIMQSFLSKEILYPSMKDFVERYPVWLEEHKATLSQEAYDNYNKQLELMKKVVLEFESETESDSEEVKKQRFQRIMNHMQQMQSLGHPPVELIGSDVPQDAAALPNLPPGMDPNQCSLM